MAMDAPIRKAGAFARRCIFLKHRYLMTCLG